MHLIFCKIRTKMKILFSVIIERRLPEFGGLFYAFRFFHRFSCSRTAQFTLKIISEISVAAKSHDKSTPQYIVEYSKYL